MSLMKPHAAAIATASLIEYAFIVSGNAVVSWPHDESWRVIYEMIFSKRR